MNIRKNIDYSELCEALDIMMQKNLPQMDLYCEIGKAVCHRMEKGAAVMASEYLNKHYPDVKGFSPRNLRRMRDFYRIYENYPALLSRAMKLRWIQNVVIMEAELTMALREWYMKAAAQYNWSKSELIAKIAANAHEELVLDVNVEMCYAEKKKADLASRETAGVVRTENRCTDQRIHDRAYRKINRKSLRPWNTLVWSMQQEQHIVYMRC